MLDVQYLILACHKIYVIAQTLCLLYLHILSDFLKVFLVSFVCQEELFTTIHAISIARCCINSLFKCIVPPYHKMLVLCTLFII